MNYGAFVRLDGGVDGMVHISQMGAQGQRIDSVYNAVEVRWRGVAWRVWFCLKFSVCGMNVESHFFCLIGGMSVFGVHARIYLVVHTFILLVLFCVAFLWGVCLLGLALCVFCFVFGFNICVFN